MGGVGGYAPSKTGPEGQAGTFSVNIHLEGRVVERITTTAGPLVEHD